MASPRREGNPVRLKAMGDYPALVVLALPIPLRERGHRPSGELWPLGAPELSVGLVVPLKERFVIGRRRDADLDVELPGIHRSHCLVEHRYGRWWLLDLGGSAGTFHNGERVSNVELEHLDVIELPPGVVFRFLEVPATELREPKMEAALAQSPDDERCWAVYADWLLDHGAALGERMAKPRKEHDGRWLGALATAWARGDVEVDWAFGLPRGLVLRRLQRAPAPMLPRSLLTHAVSEPAFRFLRALDVDIESLVLAQDWDDAFAAGLDVLVRSPLPMLETLKVGPLSSEPVASRTMARVEVLRQRCPHLKTDAASLFFRCGPPRLQVLSSPMAVETMPRPGGTVALVERSTNLVGKLHDCVVTVDAPPGHPAGLVAVRFAATDGRWWVEDLFARSRPYRRLEFALRVNDREVVEAYLRPGDTLELAAGFLVRFL